MSPPTELKKGFFSRLSWIKHYSMAVRSAGVRPKALIQAQNRKYIAKFSSSTDLYSVVKAEFIAMRLAALAGLNVAPVQLTKAAGKDVLLIERFDRIPKTQ